MNSTDDKLGWVVLYIARLSLVAALGGLVVSCAPRGEATAGADTRRPASEASPSAPDMRAARLLSLSNNSALENAKGPYGIAVACVVALDVLQSQLAESNVLSGEQQSGLRRARDYFQKQAITAGGNSRQQLASDLEAERGATDDIAERARTAVACLRKLT